MIVNFFSTSSHFWCFTSNDNDLRYRASLCARIAFWLGELLTLCNHQNGTILYNLKYSHGDLLANSLLFIYDWLLNAIDKSKKLGSKPRKSELRKKRNSNNFSKFFFARELITNIPLNRALFSIRIGHTVFYA